MQHAKSIEKLKLKLKIKLLAISTTASHNCRPSIFQGDAKIVIEALNNLETPLGWDCPSIITNALSLTPLFENVIFSFVPNLLMV